MCVRVIVSINNTFILVINMDQTTQSWAEQEFADANLEDQRRTQRLILIAEQRGSQPHASFSQSCGDAAATKAAYRFYENEDISPDAILSTHQESTLTRMKQEPIVLAVQDTTILDYTNHPATEGLGTLQNKEQQGLLMHTTLAVTPASVPLGIIHQQIWARPVEEFGKKHKRKERPIQEKESQKWLDSLATTSQLQKQLPQTKVVSIGDREADIYDLFISSQSLSQELLVRAAWDRCVQHPENHLWSYMENQPIAGTLTITVPRKSQQPTRQAELSVHYAQVTLLPPKHRSSEKLAPVRICGILACEENPPSGVEAITWLLLTTLSVTSFEEACQKIQWYSCRWLIEIYHKVLKSGCRVEERQFENVSNIRRYLAVDVVVGWYILYLTMVSRELPDIPCSAILEVHEWQSLYCFIHKVSTPPENPPTLRQAMRWIAQLGGFMGRKSDGEPGVTVLWRGLQRLHDIAGSWLIFHLHSPESRNVGKV